MKLIEKIKCFLSPSYTWRCVGKSATKEINKIIERRETLMKYYKYRFETKALDDYRPLKDMADIQCPWWCTGEGDGYVTIICYLPKEEDLFKYWDDAYDIEFKETDEIIYTDRFPKPEWIKD